MKFKQGNPNTIKDWKTLQDARKLGYEITFTNDFRWELWKDFILVVTVKGVHGLYNFLKKGGEENG